MRRLVMALVVMVGVSAPGGAQTTDTATPPTATAFTLRTSVKTGALLFGARGPEDARVSNAGDELLGRVRVDSRLQLGTNVDLTAAYEHRVRRLSTSRAASAVSVLPAEAPPPYRLAALDWQVARSDTAAWHHEIDRAAAHIRGGAADITIGRQAIGWGRGVVFGAVDLFAPFSPLEIDREWRRGIDAVHADVRLSDRASTDGVVALGRRWSDALTAVRVQIGRAHV